MSTKATRTILMLLSLSLLLSGCSGSIDESILTKPADYSINISLPYATVTPPPIIGNPEAPLVIGPEGTVIVNDSASILQNITADTDENEGNYKSLTLGNTGLAVQALQERLAELGYFNDPISSIYDTSTEAAVRRFEQTFGTMQTGVANAKLQARLFSASAPVYGSEAYTNAVIDQYTILQRGDVGSSVYALQQRLKNLGYPIAELSGSFDNETANAVMLFYEAYGLSASDVANVAMQMELYSDSAKLYTSNQNKATQSVSANEVMAVQNRLIQLGFFSGTVNGEYDLKTQTAVKLFEEACGRLPSGEFNSTLKALLESEEAPRFKDFASQYPNMLEGSSGESVQRMQERLVALGFATGTPNGEYGSATSASLELFQGRNGLDVNGVASTYTQAVLYSSFALDINGKSLSIMSAAPVEDVSDGDTTIRLDETLVLGSTGDDVTRLQERLTSLGYVSSLTGTYDNLTSRAVSAIQEDIGIAPTGTADGNLQLFIFSSAAPNNGMPFFDASYELRTLALNDSGDDVSNLQKKLWELGLLEKEAVANSVGTFNEATESAVCMVQAALNYEVANGEASPALQCYLFSGRCTAETFAEYAASQSTES